MQFTETMISGCFLLKPNRYEDNRGLFIKTFISDKFKEIGVDFSLVEEFYTISKKNVLRGLHFQIPPFEHYKIVYCPHGCIWDVVVDLRKDSPTFKKNFSVTLNAQDCNVLIIPPGLAHGFVSLADESLIVYKVSSPYSAEHDKGILWNSCGINWPVSKPIISNRDMDFLSLEKFETPFLFNGKNG